MNEDKMKYLDIANRQKPDTLFVYKLVILDHGDNKFGLSKLALIDNSGDKVHVFVLPKEELDKLSDRD